MFYNKKDELIEIILNAGQIALSEQEKLDIKVKEDNSLVTNGDLVVSVYLEKELLKLFPDHDIFSEENCKTSVSKNKVIVIDPIDGTDSYSRKEDTWAVLIGFIDNSQYVGGMIYQASNNLLYYGFKNQGSYKVKNNVETKLNALNLNKEISACSSPKDKGEFLFFKSNGISKIETSYSASLKILQIADGIHDVFANFRKKCSIWDLVAPQVILEEAGGKVLYKKPQAINYINPHIDSEFIALGQRVLYIKL